MFSTKTVLDPRTNEQTRFFFDDIAAVTAPDKYTVALRLKRPAGGVNFDYFYSVGTPCILPAHLLAHLATINTAPYNALPVGIGPFKYVRWDRESQIVMVANPLYFRGRPKLDRILDCEIAAKHAGRLRSPADAHRRSRDMVAFSFGRHGERLAIPDPAAEAVRDGVLRPQRRPATVRRRCGASSRAACDRPPTLRALLARGSKGAKTPSRFRTRPIR